MAETTFDIFVILFGLLVGSFLNVVIYRMPRDLSVVTPRSFCPECEKAVKWYQNIPLFSYLALKGKCANCKTAIAAKYPLVEFLTALLFHFSWHGLPTDFFMVISQIRVWTFIALCLSISFIDLEHRIIPDELSLGGWAFGFITCFWDERHGPVPLIVASFAGFGVFFLCAYLYEKKTGRMGIGGGDIKFMGTIGIFLGLGGVWATVLLSSILGSVIGIGYGWWQKRKAPVGEGESVLQTAIPYGPFLVLGALIELFFEVSKWLNI
jgi:leader peptidase (prepilin peptidase)/N-methyltransferase